MALPAEAPALVNRLAGRITHRADQKISPRQILAATRSAPPPSGETFVEVPLAGYYAPFAYTAAAYTPVPYVVPAMFFGAGRFLGANLLVLFFIARIANLLVATAVLYAAIRLMPFLRWVTVLLALTPMAIFMRASLSGDGLVMALAFLLIAEVVRLSARERAVTNRDVFLVSALSLGFSLIKPIAFVPLFALSIPGGNFKSRSQRGAYYAGTTIALLFGLQISSIWARDATSMIPPESAVFPAGQLTWMATHPFGISVVMCTTWRQDLLRYLDEMIGKLGWVDTPLPLWIVIVWWVVLIYVAFNDGHGSLRFGWRERLFAAAAFIGGVVLVSMTIYVTWNAVGATRIRGIQGRYFLPIMPLAFLAAATRSTGKAVAKGLVAFVTASLGLLVSMQELLSRFYGWP